MKSELPVIQSLWIGDALSNLERLCVQSFIDHGHAFHLYAYADVAGVPAGAAVKDGNEILPYRQLTGGRARHVASLSDYFRYALLNQKGGYWADMDIVCLRPFDLSTPVVFIDMVGDLSCFENCLLRFPAGHPLMQTMQELCANRLRMKGLSRTKLGGPTILTEQIRAMQLQHLARPKHFLLSHAREADGFDDAYRDGLRFSDDQYALHLMNHALGKMGIDKNAQFDAESLFEQLKSRHGIAQAPGTRRVTSAQIDEMHAAMDARKKTKRRRKKARKMLLVAAVLAAAIGLTLCSIAR